MQVSMALRESKHSLVYQKFQPNIMVWGRARIWPGFPKPCVYAVWTCWSPANPAARRLGERLRKILLNQPMHAEIEALLMFAAPLEHIEQEQSSFFEKVRQAYLDRCKKTPQRFALIDASQIPDKVTVYLSNIVASL